MSRREKLRNRLKGFKGDVKALFDRKAEGISMPTTIGTLPQIGSLVESAREEANTLGASTGATPLPNVAIMVSQRSDSDTKEGDNQARQTNQSGFPVEFGTADTRERSESMADTGARTKSSNSTGSTVVNTRISGSKEDEQTTVLIEGSKAQSVEDPPTKAPQRVADSVSAKWKGLKNFAHVLQPVAGVFGPVKEVVDMFVGCVDTYQIAEAARVEHDEVQVHLEGLLQDLASYFSESSLLTMTKSMENICGSIKAELKNISTKLGKAIGVRHIEVPEEVDAVVGCYRRIESHLRRLTLNANMEMWKVMEEQAVESRSDRIFSRVDRLPAALPAWYNSVEGIELKRRPCTPGTRVDVLATIIHWTSGPQEGAVYWLNGMAGTGKTTIAYSVCAELDELHHLGASFFCSRLREECRNVNMIIPSIAYQLARFSRPFQSALSKVLEKDPDVHGRLPHMQFDALIAKPMLEVQDTLPEKLAVVIDALDECEQKESTARMLDVLLTKSASLPIKFIVSSRPETQIRDQMTDERVKSRLVLHELDKGEVQLDIEKYLREGLAEMSPSDGQIATLVERAGILFIYAATAVRYIGYDNFQSDPKSRLNDILGGQQSDEIGGNEEIDKLYTTILEAALDNRQLRKAQRDDMRQVLYTVVCAREPLTTQGLSRLLGMKDVERVRTALRPLWSVLHVVGGSELVTSLHASFPDYMLDSVRSKTYYCDSDAYHLNLAQRCLNYLAHMKPQFNICWLGSSYIPDEDVPDIEKRVENIISSELLYACRYWADHIKAASCALSVIEHIRDFLSTRLLLWLEILNLKNQMSAGVECAKLLNEWCKDFRSEQELTELAHDAKRFVEAFAANPVSRSTPHIYVSMLTFWPKSAPIAKYYANYVRGPVEAKGTALEGRQMAHLSTWAFEKAIKAMAISHDGLHVALVIDKEVNELLVVDLSSGKVVLGPLQGHSKIVEAVAFSPDGSRILAGSFRYPNEHATILGWDTRTGNAIHGPLQLRGHMKSIVYLSFSPDCSRIATSSDDKTVRVWNALTGETLLQLQAQGMVRAAVFSPDGTRVAAGSGKTVQVWDIQSGDIVVAPVAVRGLNTIDLIVLSPDNSRITCACLLDKVTPVGEIQSNDTTFREIAIHPGNIKCIAYAPDNKHILSGSNDRAVRIWDTQTGNMVLGPLEGHTGSIRSVAFTPDGSRIISACEGGLVCTWDAQHHIPTPNSTNTPSDPITSVKFSADGARFVSGYEEGTICVWDADTGERAIGPVKLHTSRITAVDFRGDRVVSGCYFGKICVCDARSGEVVLGPCEVSSKPTESTRYFKVGSEAINSIAYSPEGNLIAVGSPTGVGVWNAQDGRRVLGQLTDLRGDVSSVQFSPDGTRIVASSQGLSSNVAVWDVSDGRNVFGTLDGHNHCVFSASYSPNGAFIVSGSADRTIIIWDAYTGKKAIGPLTGHSSTVWSVGFSPDSTRLVSGSYDETIRIWDVQTGKILFELSHAHRHWIRSVEYSPDGARILSRSEDMSVQIHDARSPEERAQNRPESEVGDWMIGQDGWVVDDQSRPLVWVPGDLRKALMRSETRVMIAPQGYVELKFDKSSLGESWARSYASNV